MSELRMGPLTLRPFTTSDLSACLGLFDGHVPRYFQAEERAGFEAFLDAPPGPFFVIVDEDGQVLACGGIATEEDGRTGSLCWGIVHPDHQRQGLGRALLLARLVALADDPAHRAVRLETIASTVGFFESLGFSTTGVDQDGYGKGVDRHRLGLVLSEPVRGLVRRRLTEQGLRVATQLGT